MPIEIPKFDKKHANGELRKRGDQEWFWVRIPVSMDSLSRQRLMQSGSGREAYCVYVHLVCLAAKDEPRGILADERGPFTIEDIALRTSIPSDVLKTAISTLEAENIQWVCQSQSSGNDNSDPIDIYNSNSNSNSNSSSNSNSEEKKKKSEAEDLVVFPKALDTPAFREKWAAWIAYRKELKLKSWKPVTITSKLKTLAKHGEQHAIETIDYSIGNGYQGLDPEWINGRGPGQAGGNAQSAADKRRAAERAKEHPDDSALTFE